MDNLNPILWGYLLDAQSFDWQREKDNSQQARTRREWEALCKNGDEACARRSGAAFSPAAAVAGLVSEALHRITRVGRAQAAL
jgi:hypothetical protein